MATSSSLLKTLLHKTIAEGLYREIVSRTSRYYYFLGKTLAWEDETAPPYPVDSFQYEKDVRNELITLKEIKPSDVAFVVPRIDWASNTVYDNYDDKYSTEVQGINIISGGTGYTSLPTVEISAPNLTDGVQATATAVVYNNQIIGATMTKKGSGYTIPPTVTFVGGGSGTGAVAVGTITKAYSGAQKLEDAKFYVMTDEFNVYKCLDNNNNAYSMNKPIGTQILPIRLQDGYLWKYMFNVPIALRTKFLTEDQMPVITALSQQFYSAGGIEAVIIENRGTGYSNATLTVSGDGYLESDPVFLNTVNISNNGYNYADGDTINIAQPVETSVNWTATSTVYQGNRILSGYNIYEVIQAGSTSTVAPTHRSGIATNGTATLKYLGSIARAYPSFASATPLAGQKITAVNLLGGVREVNMLEFGSGYTSNPVVTFGKPTLTFASTNVNTTTNIITVGSHWLASGDSVVYNNGGGTTIAGLINNTTYYVIKASSTTIKLASTKQNAIDGIAIDITSQGTGTAQKVYVDRDLAVGFAELDHVGSVRRIIITDSGDGYPANPSVTIGNPWTASTAVTLGTQYFVGNRLFTVTTAGTTNSTSASLSGGTVTIGSSYTNGTAVFMFVGTAASGESDLRYGAGYDSNPRITIVSDSGSLFQAAFTSTTSNAKLIPVLENGQIISVQVDDAGVGYSSATISVAGNGTGAVISPDISIGNINTLQANNELLTQAGTINNIVLNSSGFGYGVADIKITGDGTGATAVATITGSKVTKVTITNQGSNYTYANVEIIGNGFGAEARAVIAPYGGHGKDAFEELFARTLMFYSNVSRDKNQGFDVNNDYRQVGIIKNPRQFGTTNRYASAIGSACYSIECSVNLANFSKDMLLTTPRLINGETFQRRFRIVTVTATGMLIQSLDNDTPLVSDVMTNPNNQFFSVAAVGSPTVDKYSGDMLFIDNKAGFTPSADETVTLRTVIRF